MIATRLGTALAVASGLAGCDFGSPSELLADAATPAPPDATRVPGVATRQLCKLLSGRNASDPTANDVQHRANVLGADLGIPVVHDDTLYILFGDTIGFAGIWGLGESHPDAVGHAADTATAVAARPELLCSDLTLSTLAPDQSIGPGVDPSVVADFAAAVMIPPSGEAIGDYIRNPSGGNGSLFANLPGDFEVPSGAFAADDSIYIFYTTVAGPTDPSMKASYLARWVQPSTSGPPAYQILYQVDQRFDADGPLHGHFINIAAEVVGDHVYLFGTGSYRESGIYVARKRLDALATPGGFEEIGVVSATAGYGETSVRYLPAVNRWLVLAEELQPTSNRIVAYLATDPAGPWGEPITVHDMADPGFHASYCCAVEDDCQGVEMFNCTRTGFYGTYLLPTAIVDGNSITIAYTMSSFSPYNVALFEATFTDYL